MLAPNHRSFWEMLLTYARAFTFTAANIEFHRGQVLQLIMAGQIGNPISLEDGLGASTKAALDGVKELCLRIETLGPVADQIDRISGKLSGGVFPMVLSTELEGLNNRIMDELKQHYYYPVNAASAQLYENEHPFGEAVGEAFPSARDDIRDATRCHVLGQPTACAFHLMRAMEVALRCFAKKLGVDYRPSWDAYCGAIDTVLGKPHRQKSAAERKREPQYREILGDLMAVKLAWRNPTMHVERRYEPHEALQIFMATSILLDRLANAGVRERRLRPKEAAADLRSDATSQPVS